MAIALVMVGGVPLTGATSPLKPLHAGAIARSPKKLGPVIALMRA
jgi:hypothetical protein